MTGAVGPVGDRDPSVERVERGVAFPSHAMQLLIAAQIAIALAYVFALRPAILGGGLLTGAQPIGQQLSVHLTSVMATWPGQLFWLFAPLVSTTSDVISLNRSIVQPLFLLGLGLLVSTPIVWFWLLRRGAGLAALGWAWLWIGFLPTSGLVPLTHAVAVRYVSFSAFGAALLWLSLLRILSQRRGNLERSESKLQTRAAASVAILLVVFLADRTLERLPDWQSHRTLFQRAVEREPLYREGHYVLALDHFDVGELREAKHHIDNLEAAQESFEGNYSFLRKIDAIRLLCLINLKLERADLSQPQAARPSPQERQANLRACIQEELQERQHRRMRHGTKNARRP
jgi:vacuolar-type H+-ATPase subunit I/STV1